MKKEIMKDNSLLGLEKKLGNGSTDEIILNKFVLKPSMNFNDISKGKDFIKNINSFVENFKQNTKEFLDNPNLIEEKKIELNDKNKKSKKGEKFVKMDLALGVLDLIENKQSDNNNNINYNQNLLTNVLDFKNNSNLNGLENPLLTDQADQEILKFLMQNSKNKSRRRIHKIKK